MLNFSSPPHPEAHPVILPRVSWIQQLSFQHQFYNAELGFSVIRINIQDKGLQKGVLFQISINICFQQDENSEARARGR